MKAYTLPVTVRVRNRRLVLVGMAILALLAPVLKPATVVQIGNGVLSWLKVETRVGDGDWQRMTHGMYLTAEAETLLP